MQLSNRVELLAFQQWRGHQLYSWIVLYDQRVVGKRITGAQNIFHEVWISACTISTATGSTPGNQSTMSRIAIYIHTKASEEIKIITLCLARSQTITLLDVIWALRICCERSTNGIFRKQAPKDMQLVGKQCLIGASIVDFQTTTIFNTAQKHSFCNQCPGQICDAGMNDNVSTIAIPVLQHDDPKNVTVLVVIGDVRFDIEIATLNNEGLFSLHCHDASFKSITKRYEVTRIAIEIDDVTVLKTFPTPIGTMFKITQISNLLDTNAITLDTPGKTENPLFYLAQVQGFVDISENVQVVFVLINRNLIKLTDMSLTKHFETTSNRHGTRDQFNAGEILESRPFAIDIPVKFFIRRAIIDVDIVAIIKIYETKSLAIGISNKLVPCSGRAIADS